MKYNWAYFKDLLIGLLRWIGFFIYQLIILIDQAFNVLTGGYADETLQSRAYRAWRGEKIFGKIFKPMIDCLLFFEKDHCRISYIAEINRRHLPPQFTKWIQKGNNEIE